MLKPSRTKRLSELLPEALGPAAAKQGFAGAEIMSRWETIVGPEIAPLATPQKLAAPPRAPAAPPDAAPPLSTLTLGVTGAFALEVQHRIPEIMERVNAHLGWRCVGAVKLRQGVVRRRRAIVRLTPPPPTAEEAARVRVATSRVEEQDLASALERLGDAALAKNRSAKP